MNFHDFHTSRTGRYSIGVESNSGQYYASIPVSNGIVDYEEYYELTPNQYRQLSCNPRAAIQFAEECRRREHDNLLIQEPGSNRGTPV
ncbi:hypothetical protein U8D42_07815 [Mycobacterium europaeum]|uniref:hypothetical protein n=1 Tax=Mycobacterium europaeum TaxID=761804 RepID=UPI002ADFD927|nr:hypothetical protein [Mycobacterium europaeum]MEA1161472.1 hypothetical protein [Mycobacterium europaeum]